MNVIKTKRESFGIFAVVVSVIVVKAYIVNRKEDVSYISEYK